MLKPLPTKAVCDYLRNMPEKHFKQVWGKILGLLSNPQPNDSKKIGMIDGNEVLRADSGEYRIIYQRTIEFLKLLIIGKRNDGEVYKKFERKVK